MNLNWTNASGTIGMGLLLLPVAGQPAWQRAQRHAGRVRRDLNQ